MKRFLIAGMVSAFTLTATATAALENPEPPGPPPPGPRPERRLRPERPPRPGQPLRPERHRLPPHPLMIALDTDRDGVLSAEEIDNAADALRTLDRDGDGALSREELRPPRRPGFGREPAGPAPFQGGPGEPGPRGARFIERIMRHDANGDGVLSRDELPERMLRFFERADVNGDDVLDQAELQQMADRGPAGGHHRPHRRPGPGPEAPPDAP